MTFFENGHKTTRTIIQGLPKEDLEALTIVKNRQVLDAVNQALETLEAHEHHAPALH
jgi:hypothetical protein